MQPIFLTIVMIFTLFLTSFALRNDFQSAHDSSSRWYNPQKAVSSEAVKGGILFTYFPTDYFGGKVVKVQEKSGFASAHLKEKSFGKVTAVLSIADMIGQPIRGFEENDAFNRVGRMAVFEGFPTKKTGKNTLKALIGKRFVITIQSMDPLFTAMNMESLIEKFNLKALNQLSGSVETVNQPTSVPAATVYGKDRWNSAQAASKNGSAVAKNAIEGGLLFKFLPSNIAGARIVPTQEKKGFVSARVESSVNGSFPKMLISIADSTGQLNSGYSTATTVGKSFVSGGYPTKLVGNSIFKVLVENRFVITIESKEAVSVKQLSGFAELFDFAGLRQLSGQ